MDITIENFRNIKSLHATIQENKINFISGVSGSGKSSLAIALKGSFEELDRPAGTKGIKPTVKTALSNTPIEIFNKDVQDSLLIEEASSGVYEVIMNKDEGHRKAEAAYNQSMKSLNAYRSSVWSRINDIDAFLKQSGISINDSKIRKNCKFHKIRTSIEQDPLPRRQAVKEHGGEYLAWVSQGFRSKEEWGFGGNDCPFCEQEIDETRNERLENISIEKTSPLSSLPDIVNSFRGFGVDNLDLFKLEDVDCAIDAAISLALERNDLKALLNYMDMMSLDIRNLEKPEKAINLSSDSYDQFDGLKESIEKTLRSSKGLRSSFGVLRAQFEKTLQENGERINGLLRRFAIPYEFELKGLDAQNKKAGFTLKHIEEEDGERDFKKNLSYGERGIIALILFLLKERKEDILLVIDDPVSSYDEFRRICTYRTLMEMDCGNTILVLSHDHVFLKYALLFHARAKQDEGNHKDDPQSIESRNKMILERTGSIMYLINDRGHVTCIEISRDDYAPITEHMKNRLQECSTYLQKIINCRLYYESTPRADSHHDMAYGYLSAIMHCIGKPEGELAGVIAEIPELLKNRGITENALLETIQEELDVELKEASQVTASDLKVSDELCELERVAVYRELCGTSNPDIKDEMSDLLHMNSALVYCLNPYKYTSYSNRLRSFLAGFDAG